jgi:hypothetical protein
MAFSLFAPPSTNWSVAGPERIGQARGGFERAIDATRRDAMTAARGVAGPGGGAAAARAATQAVAPELARLRAGQANAEVAEGRRIGAERVAEEAARGNFMNNLFGGLAGIAGQMGVPMLAGLGGGGGAAPVPSSAAAMAPGPPTVPGATVDPAMPAAPAVAATAPLVGPDGMTEEERRRRMMGGSGLGELANAAAPFAGMVNPLFGLGLGAAGRLF